MQNNASLKHLSKQSVKKAPVKAKVQTNDSRQSILFREF